MSSLRREPFQLRISQMLVIEDDRIAIWKQTRTDDDVFTNVDGSTKRQMETFLALMVKLVE